MNRLKIAIFGATSNIAKGLINNFLKDRGFSLELYTRSPDELCEFFDVIGRSSSKDCIIHKGYSDFMESTYDVVINCIGVGTENRLQGDYTKYFTVTEEYDNLAIKYLNNNNNTLYLCFSSGAIYGRGFLQFVDKNTEVSIKVNNIISKDYYTITRINSEAKHRSFKDLKIVDLRLFSYFSRFIDLKDGYFITEVMSSILNNEIFKTDSRNIIRDYIHPEDLFLIVKRCIELEKINRALDVVSAKAVTKMEVLDYFASEYGLKYNVNQKSLDSASATGFKDIYCSKYNNLKELGYKPKYSSMDTIKEEAKYILDI